LDAALSGELAHDKRLIYKALRAGRGFIGYRQAGDPRGFRFTASDDTATATMGQTIALSAALRLTAQTPLDADIRLIRHGQLVARATGRTLTHLPTQPGAYRIEARRRFRGRMRGWVYSNPIYVH
jgi:hypothetical protein